MRRSAPGGKIASPFSTVNGMLRTKIYKASKNFQDRRKPLWSEKMHKGAEKNLIFKKKVRQKYP